MFVEQLFLGSRRHACADDADHVVPWFRVSNYNDPALDRADGEEPILIVTVLFVVDHEVVRIALEE